MKRLDMPDGNGRCEAYDYLVRQTDKGRSVAVVPLETGVYAYSAMTNEVLTNLNTAHHCAKMLSSARRAARSEEFVPIPYD